MSKTDDAIEEAYAIWNRGFLLDGEKAVFHTEFGVVTFSNNGEKLTAEVETEDVKGSGSGRCETCIYHKEFHDEVDGVIYDDGCACWNDEANNDEHSHSCSNYGKNKECPHYVEDEEKLLDW